MSRRCCLLLGLAQLLLGKSSADWAATDCVHLAHDPQNMAHPCPPWAHGRYNRKEGATEGGRGVWSRTAALVPDWGELVKRLFALCFACSGAALRGRRCCRLR